MQGEALRQGVGAQHKLVHRDITPIPSFPRKGL
jgi:hypothetical protein